MPKQISLQLLAKKASLNIKFNLLATIVLWIIFNSLISCGRSNSIKSNTINDADSIHTLVDTLRVATLYSPTSYFIYREQEMGYDYDLVSKFAKDKNLSLKLTVANNLAMAIELLDSGLVDLVAYEVPVTAEYLRKVIPCGVENSTFQVLVQPRAKDSTYVSDVTQLVGRDVYVEDESKYLHRMINLNDELGGGINIHKVVRDTLITEDLISMVSDGQIPLTVVDSDIAKLNKSYYPDLDVSLQVGFPQRSAWAVSKGEKWLADTINQWAAGASLKSERSGLLKRYFEQSKSLGELQFIDFSKGRMSKFDNLFKLYCKQINWDWRLLASIGYAESRYDSTQVSWAGAVGVMQLMPATAKAFGVDPSQMRQNDVNISTAVKVLKSLDKSLSNYVADPQERVKFVLAAYNSGLAHILDAIAISKKRGKAPDIWDGSVAESLLLKSNPEYYNDEVCKYGYFRGRETYGFVKTVMSCYTKAKKQIRG